LPISELLMLQRLQEVVLGVHCESGHSNMNHVSACFCRYMVINHVFAKKHAAVSDLAGSLHR